MGNVLYFEKRKKTMNVFETILYRHSYRGKYKRISIPREDLKKIMQAGLAAPSGCNMQTTSFIAIDDPEVLFKIRQVIDPPVAETAPAAICVLTQKVNAYRDKCFNIQDYSAAIENMLLAIKGLGYESCWYEGHITDDDDIAGKIAHHMGIPDEYRIVCILPVGIPEKEPKKTAKQPFESRVWFNGFGGNK